MMNRTKLWAVGLIVATFAAGALVGSAITAAWGDMDHKRNEGRRERVSYTDRLTRELGLTQAQQESVHVILERRNQAMRDIWTQARPRFDTLRAQIREEITAQLDDEQRAEFEALLQRGDSARAARSRQDGSRREH